MQINKQKYTLSQVEDIIDSHIESDRDFTFICGFELAHYIYDYLGNEYGVEANSVELSSEINEYYVSMTFFKDGDIDFFCEYAKWDQDGTYKYSEGDNLDYFVFTDMSFGDVREFLGGKDTKVVFCELVDEGCVDEMECENGNMMLEDNEIPCNCVSCKSARGEFTDDEEYEIGLVEHYAQYIENIECECGSELRNILYSMLQECMSMGYENKQEEIDEENKVINIHIDNIQFPNVTDKNELIESLSKLPEFAMKYAKN